MSIYLFNNNILVLNLKNMVALVKLLREFGVLKNFITLVQEIYPIKNLNIYAK